MSKMDKLLKLQEEVVELLAKRKLQLLGDGDNAVLSDKTVSLLSDIALIEKAELEKAEKAEMHEYRVVAETIGVFVDELIEAVDQDDADEQAYHIFVNACMENAEEIKVTRVIT